MWVGPFWIAMLFFPEHKKTQEIMQGPLFFFGPIAIWYILSFSDFSGLIKLFMDSLNPATALQGLADLLGTKSGASAAWAHMVAGDIFVTRWIWIRCLDAKCERWKSFISIFFGVMLMPLGLGLNLLLVRK
jgi:hypothetical protein